MTNRLLLGLSCCALAALLGACSGGGGGGSGGGTATVVTPPATGGDWERRGVTFDPVLAQQLLASGEFRFANADCARVGCASSGPLAGNQSQAFELHNVHFAHSADLSGAGRLVAVVDSGFRLSHQEFSGKTIHQTGNLPLQNHGTHVASLIAGNKDGRGMHGVAPGADLHLTAINPSGASTLDMANVTAGTLAAADLGAVAQNNSWGFEVSASALQGHLDSNPGATVAQGLAATIGYSASGWQNYLNALDRFQEGGVVVWALSNNEAMLSGDAMATLPHFEPRLQEAWIAAANGYFETDGAGSITRAVRLSAACGVAARFCMAGDGTTTAASAASDTSYGSGTGTSYVAPQIAGSVALLAEAFPDLTPAEWAKRLLASADNSWFGALGVPSAGTVDFGNGVTHSYSTEWGHGVLDLKAALSPIGSVAVLSGETVATSTRTSLADSAVFTPASFGDGFANALSGQQMVVFDALNRSFSVDAGGFVQSQPEAALPAVLDGLAASRTGAIPSSERLHLASLGSPSVPRPGPEMHLTADLAGAVGAAVGAGGRSSVLSLAGEGMAATSTHAVGPVAVRTYGFASGHDAVADGAMTGGGVSIAIPAASGFVSLGVGQAVEHGGMLGVSGGRAFSLGSGSSLSTVNLGFEQQLSPALRAFGRLEYGAAAPSGAEGSFVAAVDGVTFTGVELGTVLTGVLAGNDELTLSLGQPLRVESGTVDLSVPSGRTAEGAVLHEEVQAGLVPSGRQIDLGLRYAMKLEDQGSLGVSVGYALNAGHVQGASAFGVAASFGRGF